MTTSLFDFYAKSEIWRHQRNNSITSGAMMFEFITEGSSLYSYGGVCGGSFSSEEVVGEIYTHKYFSWE